MTEDERHLLEMEERITARVDARFAELKSLITAGFPGGDAHAHRMAHESLIEADKRWSKLKFGVIEKVAGGGALAALVFACHKIWEYTQKAIR